MKYTSFCKDVCKPTHFRNGSEHKNDENLTVQLYKSALKLNFAYSRNMKKQRPHSAINKAK